MIHTEAGSVSVQKEASFASGWTGPVRRIQSALLRVQTQEAGGAETKTNFGGRGRVRVARLGWDVRLETELEVSAALGLLLDFVMEEVEGVISASSSGAHLRFAMGRLADLNSMRLLARVGDDDFLWDFRGVRIKRISIRFLPGQAAAVSISAFAATRTTIEEGAAWDGSAVDEIPLRFVPQNLAVTLDGEAVSWAEFALTIDAKTLGVNFGGDGRATDVAQEGVAGLFGELVFYLQSESLLLGPEGETEFSIALTGSTVDGGVTDSFRFDLPAVRIVSGSPDLISDARADDVIRMAWRALEAPFRGPEPTSTVEIDIGGLDTPFADAGEVSAATQGGAMTSEQGGHLAREAGDVSAATQGGAHAVYVPPTGTGSDDSEVSAAAQGGAHNLVVIVA